MAILKAINCNNANRKKFMETLLYIANPEKNPDETLNQTMGDFELDTFVNRFLHGQQNRKRQFKQIVLSIEAKWSDNGIINIRLKNGLVNVLYDVENYFAEAGFLAKGAVHLNTSHPHFHLIVETCNALTGKQYSQSKADLSKLKEFVSDRLIIRGLNEVIKMRSMTEDKLLSEEESEAIINGTGDWNSGTLERFFLANEGYELRSNVFLSYDTDLKRKMYDIIPPGKRVMCDIIPPGKRIMCDIIPPGKRIMCDIIPQEKRIMCDIIPQEKCIMCDIIPQQKRVMVELINKPKVKMVEIIHQEKSTD